MGLLLKLTSLSNSWCNKIRYKWQEIECIIRTLGLECAVFYWFWNVNVTEDFRTWLMNWLATNKDGDSIIAGQPASWPKALLGIWYASHSPSHYSLLFRMQPVTQINIIQIFTRSIYSVYHRALIILSSDIISSGKIQYLPGKKTMCTSIWQ